MSNTSPDTESFSSALWREIAPIYDAVLSHPFVAGLADGTLPRASFTFYVVQDALYLTEFARALNLAAAKSQAEEWVLTFSEHAAGTLKVERSLHESFFKDFGLSEAEVRATPQAPTTLAYTSYLLSVAYSRPAHEVVAVLAPCYWVYWKVGKALLARGSPEPLYQRWIDTYADPEFGGLVEEVVGQLDELASSVTEPQRDAMRRHFVTSTRYEWMFWEMGHRTEQWPV
jgi:thiaminase/transcriptional activator TenA